MIMILNGESDDADIDHDDTYAHDCNDASFIVMMTMAMMRMMIMINIVPVMVMMTRLTLMMNMMTTPTFVLVTGAVDCGCAVYYDGDIDDADHGTLDADEDGDDDAVDDDDDDS